MVLCADQMNTSDPPLPAVPTAPNYQKTMAVFSAVCLVILACISMGLFLKNDITSIKPNKDSISLSKAVPSSKTLSSRSKSLMSVLSEYKVPLIATIVLAFFALITILLVSVWLTSKSIPETVETTEEEDPHLQSSSLSSITICIGVTILLVSLAILASFIVLQRKKIICGSTEDLIRKIIAKWQLFHSKAVKLPGFEGTTLTFVEGLPRLVPGRSLFWHNVVASRMTRNTIIAAIRNFPGNNPEYLLIMDPSTLYEASDELINLVATVESLMGLYKEEQISHQHLRSILQYVESLSRMADGNVLGR